MSGRTRTHTLIFELTVDVAIDESMLEGEWRKGEEVDIVEEQRKHIQNQQRKDEKQLKLKTGFLEMEHPLNRRRFLLRKNTADRYIRNNKLLRERKERKKLVRKKDIEEEDNKKKSVEEY